ncbi:hypothetical protein FA10DRAFT_269819 [Acaromyces ingoldii]|uniref:Uncharacterized protein n=1 Tax=Acaromyces ingoldii TaxID=215250 RepID=A0A316YDF2_9BASI|nr:hypothetical protein FA10DRAFT_269819 [Acaromyces ingoldii]PWN87232.1 hypothetical protein FA10DRAFT_269819 [Acaromyces ingoldii]
MFAAAAVGAVMIKYEQRQIRKRDNQRHRQATHEPQAASTTPQAVVTQAESTPTLTRLGRALRPGRRTDDAQAARSSAGESLASSSEVARREQELRNLPAPPSYQPTPSHTDAQRVPPPPYQAAQPLPS